jgi:DNA-binding GntR family transcriptional regulator
MTVDVRRTVERHLVHRAARYADDHQRRRLQTLAPLIEEAAENRDVLAFMRIDDDFNRLVGDAARHEVAAKIVQPLHCVSRRLGFLFAGTTGAGLRETGVTHARMMHAIADADAATAEALLDQLLEKTTQIAHEVERMQSRKLAS